MVNLKKYSRITDLYTTGTELVLEDGTVMYLAVMNAFERDEAVRDGQVARSRFVMAMSNSDSDEILRLKATFEESGTAEIVDLLAQVEQGKLFLQVFDEVRNSDEWCERAAVLERADEVTEPKSEIEREFIYRTQLEYDEEISTRVEAAMLTEREAIAALSEEELWGGFQGFWLETRGSELGLAEYKLTEIMFAARACDGTVDEGVWDHTQCGSHVACVFESKAQVRGLPDRLQQIIYEKLGELEVSEREAKNSDRQGNSSKPSPLPSEQAGSQSSAPTVTSDVPPGLLPRLSTTP